MKNTVYTYDLFDRSDYRVVDYTSRYYGSISKFFKQYNNYFTVYILEDDEKLEDVSYRLYDTTDYADLILAINEDVFLWNVPYNQDINLEQSNILSKSIMNGVDTIGIDDKKRNIISEIAKDNIERLNELKRNILVPKNEYLSTVLGLVERYRSLYNTNNILSEEEARARIGELI